MDFDTIGRNELIGRLQLGCECFPPFYNRLLKKQFELKLLFWLWLFCCHMPDILLTIMKYFPIKKIDLSVKRCERTLWNLNNSLSSFYLQMCSGRNTSGSHETKQWQEMIAKPRQPAVVWHRWYCVIFLKLYEHLFPKAETWWLKLWNYNSILPSPQIEFRRFLWKFCIFLY